MIESSTVPFGVIRNISLKIPQGITTTVNGTCETCVCALVSNPSLFSFNCFENNLTCEMYSKADQDKPFSLLDFATSAFYFLSLPTWKLTTVATRECLGSGYSSHDRCFLSVTSTQLTPLEYLWTFDSTFQDLSTTFSGTPMRGANFSSNSITGYGSSLSLSRSGSQYLLLPNPQLKLYNQSWTFEAWIYLTSNVN